MGMFSNGVNKELGEKKEEIHKMTQMFDSLSNIVMLYDTTPEKNIIYEQGCNC